MVEETGSSSRVGAVRVTLVIQSDTAPPSRSPHMEGERQKSLLMRLIPPIITISRFTFSYLSLFAICPQGIMNIFHRVFIICANEIQLNPGIIVEHLVLILKLF